VKRSLAIVALLLLLLVATGGYWCWYQWRDHSQDVPILAAARHYSVDPALVKAVVWRESRFNPRARGSRGEIGLMQIIPAAAAADWAAAEHLNSLPDLLNPYTNTDNPLAYALADYNAGRGNVLKWQRGPAITNSAVFLAQINFPTTRGYIRSVRRRYDHYRPIFPPKP
jgi:soluble lytic murein transglycosylase